MLIFLSSKIISLQGMTFHHFLFSKKLVFSQLVIDFSILQFSALLSAFLRFPSINHSLILKITLVVQFEKYIFYR
jgi:hypothetical protein